MKFVDLKLGQKFRWPGNINECVKNSSLSYYDRGVSAILRVPQEREDVELIDPPKIQGYWIALCNDTNVQRRFVEWDEFCMISMTAIAEACVGWEMGTGAQIKITYGEAVYDTDNDSGVSS